MIIIDKINSLTTEQNILACILKKPSLIYEIEIDEDDFSTKKGKRHNRAIFRALKMIAKQKDMKDSEFDMVTIVDKINKFSGLKKDIKEAFENDSFKKGVTNYVDTLKDMRIDANNIDIHIEELMKINAVNRILKINKSLGNSLKNKYHELSLNEILDKFEEGLLTVSNKYSSKEDEAEMIGTGMMDDFLNREVNEDGFVGYPTPWEKLNKFTGGLLGKGDVLIITAQTGVGKSIALKNIVKYVGIDLGQPIYWGANEMEKEKQRNRLVSEVSGVNAKLIKTGLYNKRGNEHLREKVKSAIKKIQDAPIIIDRIRGYTPEVLIRKAKYYKNKNDIVGFVWDYVKRSSAYDKGEQALRHWMGDVVNIMKEEIADPLEIFVASASQSKTYQEMFAAESQDIERHSTSFVPIKKLTPKEKEKFGIMVGDYAFVVKKNRGGQEHNFEQGEFIPFQLNEDKLLFEEVLTSR